MNITVNSQPQRIEPNMTVADLLEQLKMDPRRVAVEVNRQLVPRTEHRDERLRDGDQVEIVTLVGGG